MNLEDFPFDECYKRSLQSLIVEIVTYLADEKGIRICKIDKEATHVVFWIYHPKYSHPEHGTLIQALDDDIYDATIEIKENALLVLEYYHKFIKIDEGVSFSIRVKGIL